MASKDPETGEAYCLQAENFEDLTARMQDIVGMTCDQPPVPVPEGNVCTGIIDIVLAVDNSGSIVNFNDAPTFVKNLISTLQLGPVRIGLFQWNSKVDVIWGLDDFTKCTAETSKWGFATKPAPGEQPICPATIIYPETKAAMMTKVDERLEKRSGTTNGEEAMKYVKRLFDDRKVRKNSKLITIFLSDGFPNLYTIWHPDDPFFSQGYVENLTLAYGRTADAFETLLDAYPESQFFGIGIGQVNRRWMKNLASPVGGKLGDLRKDEWKESLRSIRLTQRRQMKPWTNKQKLFFYGDEFGDVNTALERIIGRNCVQADPSFNVDDEDPNEVDPNAPVAA